MQYEVATLEEYGFKDHKKFNIILKILKIIAVIITVFMLYLSIFIIALQSFNSSKSTTEFTSPTFYWYTHMFSNRLLTEAIKNTFLTSIIAVLISGVFGTLTAIGIYYLPSRKRQKMLLFNNIPLLNADIVTGITLMLIFSIFINLFPYLFGFTTLLIAHIFFTMPYVILSVLPKLKEIDQNMLDASEDLGVKPIKTIFKVIVPAVKSGIISGLLLSFTVSFEDFAVSYFTTGNGFDNMSIWIYSSIGKKSLFPGVYAFSTLLTVLSIIGVIIYSFVLKKDTKNAKKC